MLPAFSTALDNPLLSDEQTGAVIACTFKTHDSRYGLSELGFGDASLFVPGDLSAMPAPILLHIPARDVSLATGPLDHVSILNRVPGRIDAIADQGESALVRVRCGDQSLLARVTRRSVDELRLTPGGRVLALIKSVAVRTSAATDAIDRLS